MIVMPTLYTFEQAARILEAHMGPLTASAVLVKANEDGSVKTSEAYGNLVIKRTPGGYLVRPAR